MNRLQLGMFNLFSFIVILAIGSDIFLSQKTRELSIQLNQMQNSIINARRVEPILTNISMIIAKHSNEDPQLKEILVKHNLKVKIDEQGVEKNYP